MYATGGKSAPNVGSFGKMFIKNIKCSILILGLFKIIMHPDKNSKIASWF